MHGREYVESLLCSLHLSAPATRRRGAFDGGASDRSYGGCQIDGATPVAQRLFQDAQDPRKTQVWLRPFDDRHGWAGDLLSSNELKLSPGQSKADAQEDFVQPG